MHILAQAIPDFLRISSLDSVNFAFILAIMLILGSLAGKTVQKLKLPQVIGYLITGILLGQSGFGFFTSALIEQLQPVNVCVLSLICFVIGGTLKREILHEYRRQFTAILFFGSLLPFSLVTTLVSVAGILLTGKVAESLALGLILGAISTATAPASITVLKEHRAHGPLTTIMQGAIAMDDAMCIVLYAIASAIAGILTGKGLSLGAHFMILLQDIGCPLLTGCGTGLLLRWLIRNTPNDGRLVSYMLGAVFLTAGICKFLGYNIILSAVIMGLVTISSRGKTHDRTVQMFRLADKFTPPMFVLFFVQVGATININAMLNTLGVIAVLTLLYVLARTGGKMAGVTIGATVSEAPATVRENLRYCLLNQAGVALGLAVTANDQYSLSIGPTVLLIITTATFIVQIFGPIGVKYAITRAGESGQDREQEVL
jgi:Kef-type K+ transport system membrane component KefB